MKRFINNFARKAAKRIPALRKLSPVRDFFHLTNIPPQDDFRFPIYLDYPLDSKPRYSVKPNQKLYNIIDQKRNDYASLLKEFIKFKNNFTSIKVTRDLDDPEPGWVNGWFPSLDSMSLYVILNKFQSARYLEVGSGNSTKFARRAISDNRLKTKITSIDPHPRAEIDGLCDCIIRKGLEDVDLKIFEELDEGDILFIDNSHRIFMNSDATVVFLDILPRLKKGVLVEFHDIFLPYDYPEEWTDRYYSEQYGLACYLLAEGVKFEIILANEFISRDAQLSSLLNEIWNDERLKDVERRGSSFWIKML